MTHQAQALPPYPAYRGPNVAARLQMQDAGIAKAIDALELEIERLDNAMVDQLDDQADRAANRARIRAVAAGRGDVR